MQIYSFPGTSAVYHAYYGGGGSGGRVAIFLTSAYRFIGTITAIGGGGYRIAGPGTVYIQQEIGNNTSNRLIIDNINRAESLYVTLKVSNATIDVLELRRRAVLTLPQVGWYFCMYLAFDFSLHHNKPLVEPTNFIKDIRPSNVFMKSCC